MEALSRVTGDESRDKIRNVEVQMEVNLLRGVTYNKNKDDRSKSQ